MTISCCDVNSPLRLATTFGSSDAESGERTARKSANKLHNL